MGKVIAVCTSDRRGIQKKDVQSGYFSADWGIDGDAHAGHWHRQVSLLSADKIAAFNEKGAGVVPGAFGENLVVEGFDFRALPVGTLLRCGDVLLEMTQIGKECHSHCEIYKKMGDCIMPREGVFARVLEPGEIKVGDEMTIEPRKTPRPWQAAVITLSDKGARGEREDKSGPAIAARLRENGYELLASQFRCRFGEIDLIARRGDILCFVEVKLRSDRRFGLPRDFVTAAKQRRIRTTAAFYMTRHDPDLCARFDVAEVYDDETPPRIEYIENAFE